MAFRKSRPYGQVKPAPAVHLNWDHDLNQGLIGHWFLSEGGGQKIVDSTRVQFGSGTSLTWTTGRNGGPAASFDGSASFVNLDGTNLPYVSLDGNASRWSISLWFKTTQSGGDISLSTPTAPTMFERRQTTTFRRNFAIGLHTGSVLACAITDGSAPVTSVLASPAAVNDGIWHHAVITKNGATGGAWNMYLDGVLVTASTTPTKIPLSGAVMTLGCRTTNAGARSSFYNGQLDDVRIWNRALSARDAREVYERPWISINPPRRDIMIAVGGAAFVFNPLTGRGGAAAAPMVN